MGVPDATSVFQCRPDKGFIAFLFDTTGATSEITFEEGEGGASFITHCFAIWLSQRGIERRCVYCSWPR